MLENVSEDGKELSGCLGRHQNPGEGQGGLGAAREEGGTQVLGSGFQMCGMPRDCFSPSTLCQPRTRQRRGNRPTRLGYQQQESKSGMDPEGKLSAWEGLSGRPGLGWGGWGRAQSSSHC